MNKRFDRRGRGDSYVPPKNQLIKEKRFRAVEKDIEQVHICLGFPGFPGDTEEQFALLVLNNALGGSMSSRLFQKIREEHGMAYSVYSYPTSYSDTGYFTLYAGTGEKQAAKVVELMLREIDSVELRGRIYTDEELIRRIEGVTMESVEAVIPKVLDTERMAGAFVGRVNKRESEVKRIFETA